MMSEFDREIKKFNLCTTFFECLPAYNIDFDPFSVTSPTHQPANFKIDLVIFIIHGIMKTASNCARKCASVGSS